MLQRDGHYRHHARRTEGTSILKVWWGLLQGKFPFVYCISFHRSLTTFNTSWFDLIILLNLKYQFQLVFITCSEKCCDSPHLFCHLYIPYNLTNARKHCSILFFLYFCICRIGRWWRHGWWTYANISVYIPPQSTVRLLTLIVYSLAINIPDMNGKCLLYAVY